MVIEKMITGISNLNKFYDELDQSKIIDFTEYCDHRDDDQEKNQYIVQIRFNPSELYKLITSPSIKTVTIACYSINLKS